VRGGETKHSFGGVGFKFCDLCKRSIINKTYLQTLSPATLLSQCAN
jgi:hypothetical protein